MINILGFIEIDTSIALEESMSCTCGNAVAQVQDAVEKTAGFVDLVDAFARIEGMNASFNSATRWIQKAERAEQAGFGEQIIAMHTKQAQLARNQAVRQGRAALAALDERMSRTDWSPLVETLSQEFISHDGQQLLDDARERIRLEIVELDGIPSGSVRSIMHLVDASFDRPSGGGLNEAFVSLREHVNRRVERLNAPLQARNWDAAELRSSEDDAMVECASIATGVCLALMIVCGCIPWCWCCFWWVIVLGWLISMCVCYKIDCTFTFNGTDIIRTG